MLFSQSVAKIHYAKIAALAVVLVSLLMIFALTTNAQPAPTINYQGKLLDNTSATVADADYSMVFRLYTDPTGGTNIWSETQNVTVQNGLFSVMLGSSTPLSNVDFNQPLYLGVNIEADGEMTPRKPFGTVPAAFQAQEAANAAALGGVASSSFLRSDQDDTASGLLTFSGGFISSASSTINQLTTGTTTVTTLDIGGQQITSLTGTGLTNTAGSLTVATSTLGLGDGSFLGLTDTQGSFTSNRLLFTNSAGDAVTDSAGLTYDGTNLDLGTNQGLAINGVRYFTASTTRFSVAIGQGAGTNNTGLYNNILGNSAGLFNTGDDNNMSGRLAGRENTGDDNNFFGVTAGQANTGNNINSFGRGAGQNNTGSNNNFIGFAAGQNNAGNANNSIGYQAGLNNTGGQNNFFGAEAGRENTGNLVNMFGVQAGYNNTGSYSEFIGFDAAALMSASNTIAIGRESLRGGSGVTFITGNAATTSNNIAIGAFAGYNAQTGADNNLLLGYRAGYGLTTGANNIVIGYDVEAPSNTASNQLNIGNLLFGTGIDGTGTTLSSGNIGIGTTSPSSKLTVAGNGYFGGNLTATGTLDVQGTGTSTLAGNLDLAGALTFNSEYFTDLTGTGLTNTAGVLTVATSSLGLGDGTFLGLSDTPGSFTSNRLLFTNGAGDAVTDSAGLTYDGTNLDLAGTNTGLAFQGTRFFYASTTNDSIAIGENAGAAFNSETSKSVALGFQAGQYVSSTSSDFNNFIGSDTGSYSSGSYNNILGRNAGFRNSGSTNNIFGFNTGYQNSGSSNNIIGYEAGYNNTGSYSEFIGFETGAVMSASNTVAIGGLALRGGSDPAILGNNATTTNNTVVGYGAGYNVLTGGDNNLLLGYRVADSLTTGANNIVIGYDVEAPSNTASNQLNIGNLLFGTGIDGTGTTLSSGNIGIGTTSPISKFSVVGDTYLDGQLEIERLNGAESGVSISGLTSNAASPLIGLDLALTATSTGGGQALSDGLRNNLTAVNGSGPYSGGIVRGVYNRLSTVGAGSNASAYGVYVDNGPSDGGNQYGLYVDLDHPTTNNFSVYVEEGSGRSYFGSNVGIGSSTPSSKLTIAGDTYIGGDLRATGTVRFDALTSGFLQADATGLLSSVATSSFGLGDGTLAGLSDVDTTGAATGDLLSFNGASWATTSTSSLNIGDTVVTVAASDTPLAQRENADYIADGTNDQETIELAMNSLPSGGGRIQLLSGTFSINDEINIAASNTALVGEGAATILAVTATSTNWNIITAANVSHLYIADLAIDGAAIAGGSHYGVDLTSVSTSTVERMSILDLGFSANRIAVRTNSSSYISINEIITNNDIKLQGSCHSQSVTNSIIYNATYGIHVQNCDRILIDGNEITNSGSFTASIYFEWAGPRPDYNVISNNIIRNSQSDSIYTDGGYTAIENNLIENASGVGIYAGGESTTVSGNVISGTADHGIWLNQSNSVVIGNTLRDNGGGVNSSINIGSPVDDSIVSNNTISATGTVALITIASGAERNLIADNNYTNPDTNTYIADSGTDTRYNEYNRRTLTTADEVGYNLFNITGSSSVALASLQQTGSGDILDLLDSAGNTALIADASGNIGIGTSSPSSKLTVAGNGYFGGNLTATGTLDVQGTGTSTLAGNLDLAGALTFNSEYFTDLTGTGLTNTAGVLTVATSSLGLGDGTFLGLSDTPGSFTSNRLLFTNGAGDAVTDSAGLTYDGTDLNLGANQGLAIDGVRYFTASTTLNNISIGENAGVSYIGGIAGDANRFNVALGYEAGRYASTTTSFQNRYNNLIGYQAGFNNTGRRSNLLGYQAGFNNTGLNDNNLFGAQAGFNNTGGGNNMFGFQSGFDNTGSGNNLFGGQAGNDNTGNNNNIFGPSAGNNNTGADNNLFGRDVGFNNDGSYNNMLGFQVGYFNSGSYNNLLGRSAGGRNTGSYNNVLGYFAGYNNTGSYSEFIGFEAAARMSASNTVAIGQSALRGGAGGAFSENLATTTNNTALGAFAGYNAQTGADNNLLLGYRAGYGLTTGANNIVIGYDVEAPSNTASNQLNIGNLLFGTGIDGTGTTTSSGNIGIGTSSPASKLDVWGDFRVGTGSVPTLFVDTSDNWVGIGTTSKSTTTGPTTERLTIAGGGIMANDPSNPVEVGQVADGGNARDVTIAGRYAYVADDSDGLEIIDISDPANPVEVGQWDDGGNAYGVTIAGRYAYLADTGDGLEIIDISDPTNPVEVGQWDDGGNANDVTIAGRYAYVADQGDGLEIIDISDPQNPVEVGQFDDGGAVYGVTIAGRYAYLADTGEGLEIIDISDPQNPVEVGQWNDGGNANDVTIAGRYAYVADQGDGLEIIDISDPQNPVEVGQWDDGGFALAITIAGRYAYVADYSDGLEIIDISDPTNPVEVGQVDDGGNARSITIAGRYAYVADESDGLEIIDIGGSEFSSLFAGALGATQANIDQDLTVGQNALVNSNLNIGNDARVGGLLSIQGYSSSTDTRNQALLSLGGETDRNSFMSFLGRESATALNAWSAGLNQADGSFRIASSTSLATNPYFTIGAGGNVGIGTSSPSSKLTVAGDINIDDPSSGISILGNQVFYASSTSNSIYIGENSFTNKSNDRNIGLGENSGRLNFGGYDNVAIGYNAFHGSTTAGSNGYLNVAIGSFALENDPYGYQNVAIGWRAMQEADGGDSNTVIGAQAGRNLQGYSVNNVAVGRDALRGPVSGTNASDRNVAFGVRSGESITTGDNNIFLGFQAADSLTTGANNIVIGYDVEAPSNTSSNQLNIGNLLFGTGIDGTGTTLSSGNIGIGTSSPSSKLDVWGDFRVGTSSVPLAAFDPANNTATFGTSASGAESRRTLVTMNNTTQEFVPSDPTIVGGVKDATLLDAASSVTVAGRYAYVANLSDASLRIVDVSDPTSPTIVGGVKDASLLNGAISVTVAGRYAYVANLSDASLRIVDVSDPTSPTIVGGVKDASLLNAASSVTVAGRYAYVANQFDASLRIVDVSDPTSPTIVGGVKDASLLNGASSVTVAGRYAYVANLSDDSLRIVDVSDPTSPTIVGGVKDASLLNGAISVTVAGRYAYVTNFNDDSLRIVDVSDPTSPTIVGGVKDATLLDAARSVTVAGRYAYVTNFNDDSLRIVDVSDPTSPTIVGGVKDASLLNGARSVTVAGRYAYVANQFDDSLRIVDLGGIDTPTGNIGSLLATNIDTERAVVNQLLTVSGGLNVGTDARIDGSLTIAGTASSSLLADTTNQSLVVGGGTLAFGTTSTSTTRLTIQSNGTNDILNLFETGGDEVFTVLESGNVGIGTSTPSSKLTLENLTLDGAGVSGLEQNLVTTNSVDGATQFGNRLNLNASNTATTTIVGSLYRVTDNTTFGNTVRGLEVQTNRGGNTQGENTALSGFARTFGVRGVTTGDAGGSFEPAGGFFETEGTTQGNAIRGFSDSITTASLLSLFQSSSTFAGTGLAMNFGNGGGDFSSTSSKYLDFQNAGTSVFTVSAFGTTTIGDGTTNNQAGLQIGFGGLCVDNDGTCTASTTGQIASVSTYTGNSDLAEMYFSSTDLEPGEVVTMAGELSINRATQADSLPVLGVVSTKPGVVMGADDTSTRAGEEAYPIALAGRVPVRLSTENGPIAAGDELMLSSIPGVAMKATSTGTVIGIALEDYDVSRKYSATYINQFGDDLVDPVYEPIATNNDPRINDGCYYGGGNATGEEACEPLVATTTAGQIAEANDREAQASVAEQLATLARQGSERATLPNGERVSVGQAVMFVERSQRWLSGEQQAALGALAKASSTDLVEKLELEDTDGIGIVATIMQAVSKLWDRVTGVETRVEQLEAENAVLEQRVKDIESSLGTNATDTETTTTVTDTDSTTETTVDDEDGSTDSTQTPATEPEVSVETEAPSVTDEGTAEPEAQTETETELLSETVATNTSSGTSTSNESAVAEEVTTQAPAPEADTEAESSTPEATEEVVNETEVNTEIPTDTSVTTDEESADISNSPEAAVSE